VQIYNSLEAVSQLLWRSFRNTPPKMWSFKRRF